MEVTPPRSCQDYTIKGLAEEVLLPKMQSHQATQFVWNRSIMPMYPPEHKSTTGISLVISLGIYLLPRISIGRSLGISLGISLGKSLGTSLRISLLNFTRSRSYMKFNPNTRKIKFSEIGLPGVEKLNGPCGIRLPLSRGSQLPYSEKSEFFHWPNIFNIFPIYSLLIPLRSSLGTDHGA